MNNHFIVYLYLELQNKLNQYFDYVLRNTSAANKIYNERGGKISRCRNCFFLSKLNTVLASFSSIKTILTNRYDFFSSKNNELSFIYNEIIRSYEYEIQHIEKRLLKIIPYIKKEIKFSDIELFPNVEKAFDDIESIILDIKYEIRKRIDFFAFEDMPPPFVTE